MKKRIEFSKAVVALVMATYFFGVAFGAQIIKSNPEYLPAYLAYIGTPVGVAIGFYTWKAKAENMIKLGKPVSELNMTDDGHSYYNY